MITGRELAYGMLGAWRLLRNDASGLQYFDRSAHGALRSFWVMVLTAPAYAVLLMMQFEEYGIASVGLRQILVGGGLYVIDWLLFPVMLLRLAPALKREHEVAGYIAANNWAQILIYALALFLGALGALLGKDISALLDLVLLGLIALMQYRLLRHALQTAPPQSGLLVFSYLCLGLALNAVLYALLATGAPQA